MPYEVVPGITSALAVPAYAGIPVTQRFSSTSFTVVTGHEDPASGDGTVDWDAVARTGGTLVILMGVGRWPQIAERLLAAGLPPDTPAAAVRWGSRPEQHTTRATLATLGDHPLAAPSVIVVGGVAAEELTWFTDRPLFGKSVVVTRARRRPPGWPRRLRELGAEVVEAPTIEIVDPADGGAALRAAVADVGRVRLAGPDVAQRRAPHVRPTCPTPGRWRACGWRRWARAPPAPWPGTGSWPTWCLASSWPRRCWRSSLRLHPMAAGCCSPGPRWPATCCPMGCGPPGGRSTWSTPTGPRRCALSPAQIDAVAAADAVTFASSSSVINLVDAVGVERVPPVVVSIGPVTSAYGAGCRTGRHRRGSTPHGRCAGRGPRGGARLTRVRSSARLARCPA